MTSVPTVGLEFKLTGDNSGLRAAYADAQKAHRATASDMVKSFQEASERASIAMRVFREKMTEVLQTVGGSVNAAAKETGNLWQGAVQGAADSVNKVVHTSVSGIISAFGGAWGKMGVAIYGMLEAPISSALDRSKMRVAEWLLQNQQMFSNFSALVEATLGLPSGARERAAVAGEGANAGLERVAVGDDFAKIVDEIRKRTSAEEEAADAVGQTAGAVVRLRFEHQLLKAAGVDSIEELTDRQRKLAEATLAAVEAATERRREAERDEQQTRQYEQTVTSMTAALSRQSAMERATAEAITQTAGERARARALAMAEGFHSGRGANAANDPRVVGAIDASVSAADASARIKFTNEMTLAVHNQTDAFMLQANTIGATAGQTAKLSFELQQINAAQRAGVPVTAELRAQIEANGSSIGRMAEAVARAQESFRALQEVGRVVSSNLEQAFASFMDGTKFSWKNFITDLQKDLAKLAFKEGLAGLFGSGQKGNNPTGIIGSLLGMFGGFRADGGPVSSGKAYMVGERGPEMFVPRSGGSIVPSGGGRGGDTTIRMSVNLEGANGDETIARISRQAAIAAAAAAVQQSSDSFGGRSRQFRMLEG